MAGWLGVKGGSIMGREFNDIDQYRKILVGKTVKAVDFVPDADEGLRIMVDDGAWLEVTFSGCEGVITFGQLHKLTHIL
jgi:hypothetical protein